MKGTIMFRKITGLVLGLFIAMSLLGSPANADPRTVPTFPGPISSTTTRCTFWRTTVFQGLEYNFYRCTNGKIIVLRPVLPH